jgi:hypothetical protein
MKSHDNPTYPKNLFYDWMRTLFAPRASDSKNMAAARPVLAGVAFATAELLPWSMPWLNIKSGIQIDPLARISTLQSTKNIIQTRGYFGLIWGACPELARQVLRQPVRMLCMTYLPEKIKPYVPERVQKKFPYAIPLTVGVSTALIEVTTTLWLEGLKTYFTTKNLSTTEALKFKSTNGFATTAVRQVIAWPAFMVGNSALISFAEKHSKDGQVSYKVIFALAPINTLFFIGIPNPFDVIKTHQQAANASKLGLHNMSWFKALGCLYETAGVRGLASGVVPAMIQRMPTAVLLSALPIFFQREKARKEELPSVNEMIIRTKQRFGLL